MKERLYTLTELVNFGNYLLSEKREQTIADKNHTRQVHDCDIQNRAEECRQRQDSARRCAGQ